jgi:hypothetical protein
MGTRKTREKTIKSMVEDIEKITVISDQAKDRLVKYLKLNSTALPSPKVIHLFFVLAPTCLFDLRDTGKCITLGDGSAVELSFKYFTNLSFA